MDTRCCKYCGTEFSLLVDNDGTFDEGYCNKLHRKDHEKQLIREGKMEGINVGGVSMHDRQYKDASGETVWFPADGKPYYDIALGQKFYSAKQKAEWMRKTDTISNGSSDLPKKKHAELLHYTREQAKKEVEDAERCKKDGSKPFRRQ